MIYLKQSTASQSVLIGPFVDDTDGATPETGLSIANTDIRLSANGGNMAAKNSGGATHDEAGLYSITLDATDTATVGSLQLSVKVTGALYVFHDFQVLEEAIYDSLIGSGATGDLGVDVVSISGDSGAADNLEADYDGTGYSKTNSTVGNVTLVDTTTDVTNSVTATADDKLLLQDTTIATLASQTSFTLTAGSTDDDAYNGCLIVIEDVSTGTQKAVGVIDDYTGSTKTVTLLEDPGVFTMAATDKAYVIADRSIKSSSASNYSVNIGNTGLIESNVQQVSDDPDAAQNLEKTFDGTGYTDEFAPATQIQVDSIGASSGGSVNIEATEDNTGGAIIDAVTFVGSVQSGTFANTQSTDGVLHDIDDTATDIDIVYGFDIGGARTATSVSFDGFCQGNGDDMSVQVYDHTGADWETVGTVNGQTGTINNALELPLLLKHTGIGAELGKVYIRFNVTDASTPSNLSVDRLLVSAVTSASSLGFINGAVWIDTVNGTAGTGSGVGTITAPVDNIDDALTIAAANNLSDLHIAPGSTVTPTGSVENYDLIGHEYTIDCNGQSFAGSYIEGASISASTVTGSGIIFKDCIFDANATIPPCTMRFCYWGNITLTAGSTGDYFFNDCRSRVSGSDAPTFDFNSGSHGLSVRSYSGGLKLVNMTNSDTASIEGTGAITEVTSTGGTVSLRGAFAQNNITNITVTQDDVKANIDLILEDTGTTIPATITTAQADLDIITGADGANLLSATQASIDAIEADTNELQSDDIPGVIAALNDVAATDIVSAGAITTLAGAVVNVDLVDTTTTNSDMRGTDSASTHTAADVWTASGRALSDPAGFKKNTAADLSFVLRDSSDGRTPIASESVTAQRSIDGAAFGACANSVTEIGNGAYIITLAAADLNGDIAILRFTSTNSDDLLITIKTET